VLWWDFIQDCVILTKYAKSFGGIFNKAEMPSLGLPCSIYLVSSVGMSKGYSKVSGSKW
jgi:hypothetical protein